MVKKRERRRVKQHFEKCTNYLIMKKKQGSMKISQVNTKSEGKVHPNLRANLREGWRTGTKAFQIGGAGVLKYTHSWRLNSIS